MSLAQSKRIQKLQSSLRRYGLDAVVVLDRYNTRYFTGFQCTYSLLVIDPRDAFFVTDPRYGEAAEKALGGLLRVMVQPARDVEKFLRTIFKDKSYDLVGFEGSITVNDFDGLKRIRAGKRYRKSDDAITSLRIVKDEEELGSIRKAVRTGDRLMKQVLDLIKPGMTELELSRQIRFLAEELGAQGESFANIVASGPNSSRPHHHAVNRKMKAGDPVTVDLGVLVEGYCSDLTRTVVIGEPDPEFKKIYKVCLEANMAAIESLRPGMTGQQVDAVAREIITEAGYGQFFGHGLGHGVGLEIHEDPRLNARGTEYKLEPGNIVTIEPGIYLPGRFGVRIEDYAVVTKDGAEVLSKVPKRLKSVGE